MYTEINEMIEAMPMKNELPLRREKRAPPRPLYANNTPEPTVRDRERYRAVIRGNGGSAARSDEIVLLPASKRLPQHEVMTSALSPMKYTICSSPSENIRGAISRRRAYFFLMRG